MVCGYYLLVECGFTQQMVRRTSRVCLIARRTLILRINIPSIVSLKEVQEYPEDFDGVVVGSPANWWTHLLSWYLHLNQVSLVGSSRYISATEWSDVVAPEVMKQCDALDGVGLYDGQDSTLSPQLTTSSSLLTALSTIRASASAYLFDIPRLPPFTG